MPREGKETWCTMLGQLVDNSYVETVGKCFALSPVEVMMWVPGKSSPHPPPSLTLSPEEGILY